MVKQTNSKKQKKEEGKMENKKGFLESEGYKKVTRRFLTGALKGLTYTEYTKVQFNKGWIYTGISGHKYIIEEAQ